MPEVAEVRLIAEALAKRLCGRNLLSVNVLSGRYLKKPIPGSEEFEKRFPTKIMAVGVHGKFLYAITENDLHLHHSLGMSGSWSVTKEKHSRVEFVLDDGSVYYDDIRNFGTLSFVSGRHVLISKIKSLGPDILNPSTSSEDLCKALLSGDTERNICEALMCQKTIAGCGNYLKAEALYRTCLSPLRNVNFFSEKEILELCKNLIIIARDSYAAGGNIFRTHKNFDGSSGKYASQLMCYNRKIDTLGNVVVKTLTPDGRQTHWCPARQN